MSVDLGCKDWREAALLFFAEICNRCDVKNKSHDYSLCEKCPKALTVHRLSNEDGTRDLTTEMIIKEVKDHAAYWKSDMAKRITVEKHLAQKGIQFVETRVDELIKAGKLELIPKPRGDYLRVVIKP